MVSPGETRGTRALKARCRLIRRYAIVDDTRSHHLKAWRHAKPNHMSSMRGSTSSGKAHSSMIHARLTLLSTKLISLWYPSYSGIGPNRASATTAARTSRKSIGWLPVGVSVLLLWQQKNTTKAVVRARVRVGQGGGQQSLAGGRQHRPVQRAIGARQLLRHEARQLRHHSRALRRRPFSSKRAAGLAARRRIGTRYAQPQRLKRVLHDHANL